MNQLPYNTEAERSVIGCILIDNIAYDKVVDLICPDSFYDPIHREIFNGIQRMLGTNQPVDIISLDNWLAEKNLQEVTGGIGYLAEIQRNTQSAANIAHYAKLVANKAVLRGCIHLASELIEEAQESGGKEAAEIIGSYTSKLEALSLSKSADAETFDGNAIATDVISYVESTMEVEDGQYLGLSTGLADLDEKLQGLKKGEVVIVAGRPGMGKTALAMNIADHVARTQGHVLVFSMEMSQIQLGLRQAASMCSIPLDTLQSKKKSQEDLDKLSNYCRIANDELSMTVDFRGGLTPAQLRAKARQISRKHKDLSLIVIDYLQLMAGDRKTDNRVQEISEISRQIKALSKELHVPIIALSQLNRGVEGRGDKRPMLSDLRESGAIEQDADTVLLIYRDDYYNPDSAYKGVAEINIAKNRMAASGGWVKTLFQGEYSRFSNLAHDWMPEEVPARKAPICSFAK